MHAILNGAISDLDFSLASRSNQLHAQGNAISICVCVYVKNDFVTLIFYSNI